jgi:uncharacterized membrane protein
MIAATITSLLVALFTFATWFLAIWLGGRVAEKYGWEKLMGWLVGFFFHFVGVLVLYIAGEVIGEKSQPPTA